VPYRFLVDTPLGRLARWLRILGFDAEYVPETQEIGSSSDTARIIVARPDKISIFQDQACCPVKTDRVFDQVAEIRERLGLTPADIQPFSRCIRCNRGIEEIPKKDVRARVPDYVWQTHSAFNHCVQCGRIYWRGSHFERSRNIILEIFH